MEKASKRILALDLIRGYFLIAIIADHVSWNPNLFFLFTGGMRLYASPAEGFFIISGALIGYLYSSKIIKETKRTIIKLWRRGLKFYVLSAIFTFIFHIASLNLPEYRRPPIEMWTGNVGDLLQKTLTLHFSYGWTDFLPRYSVFMFVAPLALYLIAKNKWRLLALASIAVWLFLGQREIFAPFSAWQILFFGGMILGRYLPEIESYFKNLKLKYRKIISRTLGITALATYAFSVYSFVLLHILGKPDLFKVSNDFYNLYLSKSNVGIGRITLDILWFSALYLFVRKNELKINRLTRGYLVKFGTNSLLVYCVHAFVLYAITAALYPIDNRNVLLSTFYTAATIIVVFAHFNFINRIRNRY